MAASGSLIYPKSQDQEVDEKEEGEEDSRGVYQGWQK